MYHISYWCLVISYHHNAAPWNRDGSVCTTPTTDNSSAACHWSSRYQSRPSPSLRASCCPNSLAWGNSKSGKDQHLLSPSSLRKPLDHIRQEHPGGGFNLRLVWYGRMAHDLWLIGLLGSWVWFVIHDGCSMGVVIVWQVMCSTTGCFHIFLPMGHPRAGFKVWSVWLVGSYIHDSMIHSCLWLCILSLSASPSFCLHAMHTSTSSVAAMVTEDPCRTCEAMHQQILESVCGKLTFKQPAVVSQLSCGKVSVWACTENQLVTRSLTG